MKTISLIAILLTLSVSAIAKEGFYSELSMARNIGARNDLNFVNDAFGPDISLGYKFDTLSVEGEWIWSEHQSDEGFPNDDFSGLSANVLIPFLNQKNNPGELYGIAGYGNYKLDLSNGSKLEGWGYNLGLGSDYYYNEKVALVLRMVYRSIDYDRANNPAQHTPLDGTTVSVQIGIKSHF